METAPVPRANRPARFATSGPSESEAGTNASTGRSKPIPVEPEGVSEGQRGVALFRLDAPAALSVKLAADFTTWDRRPVDLVREVEGPWRLTVELPPGRYAYRFLVDGEWADDPQCRDREPNPYGSANSIIVVI